VCRLEGDQNLHFQRYSYRPRFCLSNVSIIFSLLTVAIQTWATVPVSRRMCGTVLQTPINSPGRHGGENATPQSSVSDDIATTAGLSLVPSPNSRQSCTYSQLRSRHRLRLVPWYLEIELILLLLARRSIIQPSSCATATWL
jgi:hypothetical protein